MARKFEAILISAVGTALPCLIAGAIVGLCFISSFWYWMLRSMANHSLKT